jgi:hypothetical protein
MNQQQFDAANDPQPGTFVWLCHHGQLLEWLTEPMSARVGYIREHKPPHEVATRLEWFRVVLHPERLPIEVRETYAALRTASAAWQTADAALRTAYADWQKAMIAHRAEIEALHREECPGCPWDGKTLVFEEATDEPSTV